MQLDLTHEQEVHLSHIAALRGQNPGQVLIDAALSLMEEDADTLSVLQSRLAEAEREDFLTQAQMDARVQRMLATSSPGR